MDYHFFRKLSVTLVLVMTFTGCAIDETVSKNDIIGLKAENTLEGIVLTLDHIPSETTRMFIHIMEVVEGENALPMFADIKGTQLDQVKERGKVVYPFVQNGHHYFIGVSVDTWNNEISQNWSNVEITADNGIHTLNEIALELNKTQTGVTLSAEPVFSTDVQFASKKFGYVITIKPDIHGLIGYGDFAKDDLTWEFLPGMVEDIKKDKIQLSGNLPAYVTAYCNVNYDDLLWKVGIVNSKEFTVSF